VHVLIQLQHSITFALLSQETANWQTYSQVAESSTGTGVKVSVQKLGAASHSRRGAYLRL